MSSIFEDVTITWSGKEYVVPANKVMGLVEVIEDIVTLEELYAAGVKRIKLSRAFTAALRYAGAKDVTDEQVYSTLFGAEAATATAQAIGGILHMMIPPEHIRKATETPKKPTPKPRPRSAKGSSRKPIS